MKLELKNIKVHEGLSEETFAYTARVYIDGKASIEVSNAGHGGCDYQYPIGGSPNQRSVIDKVDKWLAANHPAMDMSEYDMDDIPATLETWCGEQVADHLVLKDMRRALKSKVLFTNEAGELRECRWKGVRAVTDKHIGIVFDKYAPVNILNKMPEHLALEEYRKHAA